MTIIHDSDDLRISEMGDESELFSRSQGAVMDPTDIAYLIDKQKLRTSGLQWLWYLLFGDQEVTNRRNKLFWKAFWAAKFSHYDAPIPYRAYANNRDPLWRFTPIHTVLQEVPSTKQTPLEPTPLFKTAKSNGKLFVQTDTFGSGSNERPVLKYSSRFRRSLKNVGQALVLQHALSTDEVCSAGTHLVSADVQRTVIADLQHEGWVSYKSSNYNNRMPISRRQPLDGVLYVMFTREHLSHTPDSIPEEDVPRYIGIAKRTSGQSKSLNSGFTQIKSDMSDASANMARWGYGTENHLGALSQACFEDPVNYKRKYKRWADALFVDSETELKRPVYVEILPWFDKDVKTSEKNAIMQAGNIYGSKLLNDKHNLFEQSDFDIEN
ncbi:hypothetical protein [Haloarcula rubripromontorii]|uniref:hypothetical protein n=1 Tax=Haloarcula rubripromontorii TaxID=1705562 RepID=UPI00345C059F